MAYDIRPLSFGEILDRAFRVYLDNFLLLFGISALVWIPAGILLEIGAKLARRPSAISIFGSVVLFVVISIQHAALIVGVGEVYLDRHISIKETYLSILRLVPAIVGTYLLVAVILFVAAVVGGGVVGGLVGALSASIGMKMTLPPTRASIVVTTIAMMSILGGLATYVLTNCSLVGPVMILERRFGWYAMRRSRELVKGAFWRTLGIVVVAALIAHLPGYTLGFVWSYIPVVGLILGTATHAISTTYGMVASVIYYFDRRCRTEDFDLRLLAEQVRADAQPTMIPAPASSTLP